LRELTLLEIRFRVSSVVLIKNSAYFQKMLTGPWEEAQALAASSEQPTELRLKNGEVEAALLLLLNIMHGEVQEIPKTWNICDLGPFTHLVDFYMARECVLSIATRWAVEYGMNINANTLDKQRIVCVVYFALHFKHAALFSLATSWLIHRTQTPVVLRTHLWCFPTEGIAGRIEGKAPVGRV
jgi:hypothetical protein